MFMTMRAAIPEYFGGWDPYKPEIQSSLALGQANLLDYFNFNKIHQFRCLTLSNRIKTSRAFLPLLGYDQLCRKVIIMRPGSFDPVLNKPMIVEKANFMVGEVMCHLDPIMFITGVVVIVDMKGYDVNHMAYRSLPMLKKYMRYTQVRTHSINESIMRSSSVKILALIKLDL